MKLLLSILSLFIIFACTKTVSTSKLETELIGNWMFSEATFKAKGSKKHNVINNWDHFVLSLKEGGDLIMIDRDHDIEYLGYWWIGEDYKWDSNDEEYDKIQYINLQIWDLETSELIEMTWSDPMIGGSKLKVKYKADDGQYKFELKKL